MDMNDEAIEAERARAEAFLAACLSLDLEVGKRDELIYRLALVRGDDGRALVRDDQQATLPQNVSAVLPHGLAEIARSAEAPSTKAMNPFDFHAQARAALDSFSRDSQFLISHNLLAFDYPRLCAAAPELQLLRLPLIDTLRLNPLAFPANPYHKLVKHYQDGQLNRGRFNDPKLDAETTLGLLRDQFMAFCAMNRVSPDRLLVWHWLTTLAPDGMGFDAFFSAVRQQRKPVLADAQRAIGRLLEGMACEIAANANLGADPSEAWDLAYALAWLSVAGGNSVMPPWVRHQFPGAARLVKRLRDTRCGSAGCAWCTKHHDPTHELQHWFKLPAFRDEPQTDDGRPMQLAIVDAAMQGQHVLGILPTGTGKSLCYQIPALSRYSKTGDLTVLISPLVALMADQVVGLEKRGIHSCAAINGMLSMPERRDVLDRVRLGDVAIVVISPEQLRNSTVRTVLAQRAIGAWVLDEAHCLSKWGHDFRPDYRYVGRFIKERTGDEAPPPILCLTATAKLDVVDDIRSYFRNKLDVELQVFNGGASRTNLDFAVYTTSVHEKLADVQRVLSSHLPAEMPGGAIVYCATRRKTEEVATFLQVQGLAAAYFHAGMKPEDKKKVQTRFIDGDLRVIAATNAFGMGIDKPDVRLVIHADVPGSLENYVQEAGRAGRDRNPAECILLYTPEDIERQFGMSARSRLTRREIQAILKAIKRLDRRKKQPDEPLVATSGEILSEDKSEIVERDTTTEDTRVRTAISWLEEAACLTRDENHVRLFPSSLRIASVADAKAKIERAAPGNPAYCVQLVTLVEALVNADPDEGLSTDRLMVAAGMKSSDVRKALYDLERLGIASNDTALTAFVHVGVERASKKRFDDVKALEVALLDVMREEHPDMVPGESSTLNLRLTASCLRERGHQGAFPDVLARMVRSIGRDGKDGDDHVDEQEAGAGKESWFCSQRDPDSIVITPRRSWSSILKTVRTRQLGAKRLLEHLVASLPPGTRGNDCLAETTLGKMRQALEGDLVMRAEVTKDMGLLLDRALLWLHEQEIIRLNRGLAVFRQAMTISLPPDERLFLNVDFVPLADHYHEQTTQIHVMAEYVRRGLERLEEARELVMDYFSKSKADFLARWLPGQKVEVQTLSESLHEILGNLNPTQKHIVADEREQTNVLVLAGPGSGKTRVLVHRIAYLVRVRRENPDSILALAYNRHAAAEIRQRLRELIGDESHGVTIMTCHALAMQLAGVTVESVQAGEKQDVFKQALKLAIALLGGNEVPTSEAEETDQRRERLLGSFRWILVDEYQDVDAEQYALIAALAGRSQSDPDAKLNLFAVGDDDQNIYAFARASVAYIRRFEADYKAKPVYLVENYRSTQHIITAANHMIAPSAERMKVDNPITIDKGRKKAPPGGKWEKLDGIGRGRVLVVPTKPHRGHQAWTVMTEMLRLASCDAAWDWSRCAVIAREWRYLDAVEAFCKGHGIPCQRASAGDLPFWRLRETQALVVYLRSEAYVNQHGKTANPTAIAAWLANQPDTAWWRVLAQAITTYWAEFERDDIPTGIFVDWLAEWGREIRSHQAGLLLLSAHRAKGLEFGHVAVLDGGWDRVGANNDPDAVRRLYYVAMTRARQTLMLARSKQGHRLLDGLDLNEPCFHVRNGVSFESLPPELDYRTIVATMEDVDLGFAGRKAINQAIHGAIAALQPGDMLHLDQSGERWLLKNPANEVVGRMAAQFRTKHGKWRCLEARVAAIATRRRQDETNPDFQHMIQVENWEIVLPELVFAG